VKVLLTGVAGFIGMHCAQRLLERGDEVVGIDNFSPYYAVELKQARLARLEGRQGFRFSRVDIADSSSLKKIFESEKPDAVLHLAAQTWKRCFARTLRYSRWTWRETPTSPGIEVNPMAPAVTEANRSATKYP